MEEEELATLREQQNQFMERKERENKELLQLRAQQERIQIEKVSLQTCAIGMLQ